MTATVPLHHRIEGPDDAPVVVLLHAIGTSLEMWAPQVPVLSGSYRLLSRDLRGHGIARSGRAVRDGRARRGRLGAPRRARHRAGVGVRPVARRHGGHHDGRRPTRTVWIHLVAACAVAVPPSPAAWRDRARRVLEGGTPTISDLVVERWGYSDRAPQVRELVQRMLAATPAAGYAGCCEAIAAMDLRPALSLVSAPTLLLAGSDDPAAPPSVARELAAAMPDARVEVIAGAAHLLNVEFPTATTAAIVDHLGR